jgi:hypothetical protein
MLSSRLPGRAYLFGEQHEHHLHLFQLDRNFELEPNDETTELLMYDIDRGVRDALNAGPAGMTERLHGLTGSGKLLHGFQIDDHYFEPSGYSLNSLSGDRYLTIHATPTEQNSYVSVETNHDFVTDSGPLIKQMLETFRPRAYDLIRWESGAAPWQLVSEYELKAHVTRHLSCGYRVEFMSFFRPLRTVRTAIEIPLTHK